MILLIVKTDIPDEIGGDRGTWDAEIKPLLQREIKTDAMHVIVKRLFQSVAESLVVATFPVDGNEVVVGKGAGQCVFFFHAELLRIQADRAVRRHGELMPET